MSVTPERVLTRAGLEAVFRRTTPSRLRVLAYHAVDDPGRFARHLDLLAERYSVISLADVIMAIDGHADLPARAVLITFDDGDRSVLEVGLPLLRVRRMPAVLFVVAGFVGTDTPYWWEEVAAALPAGAEERVRELKRVDDSVRCLALAAIRSSPTYVRPERRHITVEELQVLERGGIEIGSHSMTHPCLDRCDTAEITRQVQESHGLLSAMLERPPTAFAYPNGDEDERVVAAVAACGYHAAFRFDHRTSRFPPDNALRISRLRVSSSDPLDLFALKVSGAHTFLLRARGRA